LTPGSLFWLAAAGLAVTTLAAVGVVALHEFSRHELEEYCNRRRRMDRFGAILDDYEEVALAVQTLQSAGTVLFVLAGLGWYVGPLESARPPTWPGLLAGVGIGAVTLLLTTVWLPWAFVRVWSAPFLFHTWQIWRALGYALSPLIRGVDVFEMLFRRLAGKQEDPDSEEDAFEDEIRAIVTEGQRDGLLEPEAREMIEGVIELHDADVADIMTPRSRIDALEVNASWDEIVQFVIRHRRTRIPVYEETLDRVVGVLYVKDMLPELARPAKDRRPLRLLARKPWFVPRTKKVDDLLREFLRTHNHMALVLDEYSAVAGLITIEDVLEEIVGEIVDEHDKEEAPPLRRISDTVCEALGGAPIDDLNEQLSLDLPEDEDFGTVAGLMLSRLGRVPGVGEKLKLGDVTFTVLEASPRRIDRIRLELTRD